MLTLVQSGFTKGRDTSALLQVQQGHSDRWNEGETDDFICYLVNSSLKLSLRWQLSTVLGISTE